MLAIVINSIIFVLDGEEPLPLIPRTAFEHPEEYFKIFALSPKSPAFPSVHMVI